MDKYFNVNAPNSRYADLNFNELEFYNMSILHILCDEKWFAPENALKII